MAGGVGVQVRPTSVAGGVDGVGEVTDWPVVAFRTGHEDQLARSLEDIRPRVGHDPPTIINFDLEAIYRAGQRGW
jgi:hypothetical protein